MKFKRFPSIENTYKQRTIDQIKLDQQAYGMWVVTEKIDGANFSFWCNGDEIKVASRNQWVGEDFYSCGDVVEKYRNNVAMLYKAMCKPGDVIAVFGEIFGDGVQNRVKYGEKDFRFFEIVYNGTPLPHGMNMLATDVGLPHTPVIGVADFDSALTVEQNFRSHLTPETYEGENPAEGVVIAPWEPRWFVSGKRIILKKKAPAFQEKTNEKVKVPETPLNNHDKELLAEILQYNTESRVHSVASKEGQITNKDFGKLMGLTVKDLLEEWGGDIKAKADDPKKLGKALNKEVSFVVRKVFLTLI